MKTEFLRERSLEAGDDYSSQVHGKMNGNDYSSHFGPEMEAFIIESDTDYDL